MSSDGLEVCRRCYASVSERRLMATIVFLMATIVLYDS
jgi:hypothetical protein